MLEVTSFDQLRKPGLRREGLERANTVGFMAGFLTLGSVF